MPRVPLLTAAGRAVLGGSAVLYAAGVALGYPELLTVAAGGLAMLLLAGVAVLVRPRLALHRRVQPDRTSVGTAVLARLEARNLARLPSPPFRTVDRVDGRPVELAVASIRAGATRTLHYPVPARRRGRTQVGPVTVERRDPLGLLRRAQRHGDVTTVWVHPRVHRMAVLPIGVLLDYEGRQVDRAPRGSVTFSSLREYVPGDDPRLVHWKATARTGTLMVKEHVDTSRPTTTVLLDARRAVWADDAAFEHGVEVAASAAVAAERGGRDVDLRCVGEDVAAVRAAGGVGLLDRLAALEAYDDPDPALPVALAERAEAGGALVVVTGDREPATVARLAAQRRRFAPVVVLLLGSGGPLATSRQSGVTVIRAGSAPDAAGAWNQMVLGRHP